MITFLSGRSAADSDLHPDRTVTDGSGNRTAAVTQMADVDSEVSGRRLGVESGAEPDSEDVPIGAQNMYYMMEV